MWERKIRVLIFLSHIFLFHFVVTQYCLCLDKTILRCLTSLVIVNRSSSEDADFQLNGAFPVRLDASSSACQ